MTRNEPKTSSRKSLISHSRKSTIFPITPTVSLMMRICRILWKVSRTEGLSLLLAKLVGTSVTYISSVERGLSFPRGDKLVAILNALNATADSVFCDVVKASAQYRACVLYDMLLGLSGSEKNRILETIDFLIRQSKKESNE